MRDEPVELEQDIAAAANVEGIMPAGQAPPVFP
jgi:hypothetical protein